MKKRANRPKPKTAKKKKALRKKSGKSRAANRKK